MDRADARLIVDIGVAAAAEASRSIVIKVETLPGHLRVQALLIALMIQAQKAKSMRRVVPGAERVAALVDMIMAGDEADLHARVASVLGEAGASVQANAPTPKPAPAPEAGEARPDRSSASAGSTDSTSHGPETNHG